MNLQSIASSMERARFPLLACSAAIALSAALLLFSACGDDAGGDGCNSAATGPMAIGESGQFERDGVCRFCICESPGLPACQTIECGGGGAQPGDGQPGDGQPGDGQPGDGQPGDGQPGDGQPGDGQPGDGQPGDGQPGDGQPGDGQPGDGQPGESAAGTGDLERPGIEMPRCGCTLGGSAGIEAALNAIGLCDGSVDNSVSTGDPRQFAVMSDYFGIPPRGGADCLFIMSTGIADTPPTSGGFLADGGVGSGHDFGNTASDPRPGGSQTVYDLTTLALDLTPPPGAEGFRFDFMFLSAEWPQYLCQQYNDAFLTVLESNEVEGGRPTNIAVDNFDNEVSVNIAFLELPREWTVDLSTTPFGQEASSPLGGGGIPIPGFEDLFPSPDRCPSSIFTQGGCQLPDYCGQDEDLGFVGSGTGWLAASSPIDPNEETIRLTFSIHDEGDGVLDSKVLITNFQWLGFPPSGGIDKW